MYRHLHSALSTLALMLGLIHLTLVPVTYPVFSLEALWFAGSGLAIIMVALMNFMAPHISDRRARLTLSLGNAVMAGFFGLALSVLQQPQVVLGLVIFIILAVLALRRGLQNDRELEPLSPRAITLTALIVIGAAVLLMSMSHP
jgi:hypothetical protein